MNLLQAATSITGMCPAKAYQKKKLLIFTLAHFLLFNNFVFGSKGP